MKIVARLLFTAVLLVTIQTRFVQADEEDWVQEGEEGLCDIRYYKLGNHVSECEGYTGDSACTEKWQDSPLTYCRNHTQGGSSNIGCTWNMLANPNYTFSNETVTCTTIIPEG